MAHTLIVLPVRQLLPHVQQQNVNKTWRKGIAVIKTQLNKNVA